MVRTFTLRKRAASAGPYPFAFIQALSSGLVGNLGFLDVGQNGFRETIKPRP
jgi:hypothetical protein